MFTENIKPRVFEKAPVREAAVHDVCSTYTCSPTFVEARGHCGAPNISRSWRGASDA